MAINWEEVRKNAANKGTTTAGIVNQQQPIYSSEFKDAFQPKASFLDSLGYIGKRVGTGLGVESTSGLINTAAAAAGKTISGRKDNLITGDLFAKSPIDRVKDADGFMGKLGELVDFGSDVGGSLLKSSFPGLTQIETGKQALTGLIFNDKTAEMMGYRNSDHLGKTVEKKMMGLTAPLDKISENVRKEGESQPKWAQTAGDVGGAVGMMIPSIGLSVATKSPGLGLSLMGGIAGGHSAQEVYQKTGDIDKAWNYGVASGLAEVATEKLFGGIPGLGKGFADDLLKKVSSKVLSKPKLGRAIKEIGAVTGEGVEELIVGIVDPFLRQATFDPDASMASKEDLIEQFTIGSLAALVLRAGAAPINATHNLQAKNAQIIQTANALNDLAETLPTQFRPAPIQVTSRTTMDDLKAFEQQITEAANNAMEEVKQRDDTQTPISDRELFSNPAMEEATEKYRNAIAMMEGYYGTPELTPEMKENALSTFNIDLTAIENEIAAAKAEEVVTPDNRERIKDLERQYQDGVAMVEGYFGTRTLTPEMKADALANFNVDFDAIEREIALAQEEDLLPPRMRLEKAIANGTAEKYYPASVLKRYYAQSQTKNAEAKVTFQDKSLTKEEFKKEVLAVMPEKTDQELEAMFVKAQLEDRMNPDVESFVKEANRTFAEYGVKIDIDYNLPVGQNGFFDPATNTIVLNGGSIKNRGVASYVLSHEITHYASMKNPALLQELKVSMKMLGYDLSAMNAQRRALYERMTGNTLSDEYMTEESIADFVSILMRDDSVLIQLAQKRRGVLEQIRDFILERLRYRKSDRLTRKYHREVVKRLQAALDGKPIPKSKMPASQKADAGVNSPIASESVESSVESSIGLKNLYVNSKFSLQPISQEVRINGQKTEVKTHLVSIQPEILAAFKDLPAQRMITSFEEAEWVQTNPERVKDWAEIYAAAIPLERWSDIKKQGSFKLENVPIVSLTKGCQRSLATVERVANGVLPEATRTEACYGGDCWVNKQFNSKWGSFENMEVRDLKLADPTKFDKMLARQDVKDFLNQGDFIRHGQQGDDSHLFASGVALEWLKACRKNGITKKNIFITAGYAPTTLEQYEALKPYADLFEIHFSNSGWFHQNEIMLRLNEFRKAREAGLPATIRLVTNKDNISGIEMVNEGFILEWMEKLGVTQKEVLETPFHDDELKNTKQQDRSEPTGLFENVCCETGKCKTCGIGCMVKINKLYDTLKPEIAEFRTDGEIPSTKKYSLGIQYDQQYNTRKEIMQLIKKYYQKDGDLNVATDALADLKEAEGTYVSSRRGKVDRFRIRDGRSPARGDFSGAGRLLGKGFADELIDKGRINMTGIKVRGVEDLATLAQVYRDPRFETFRIFFMKGNEIVGQQAVSSRLPSVSKAFMEEDISEFARAMTAKMNRLGADGYYLMHNHPSGEPTPSQADVGLTYNIMQRLPGFRNHIIIDSDKYSDIYPTATGLAGNEDQPLNLGDDLLLTPSHPHPLIGMKVTGADDFAIVAKQSQLHRQDMSIALFTSSGDMNSVRGATVKAVLEIDDRFAAKNLPEFKRFLEKRAREYGGAHTFIVTDSQDRVITAAYENLVLLGAVTDVYLKQEDDSVRNKGVNPMLPPWQDILSDGKPFKERTPIPNRRYSLDMSGYNYVSDLPQVVQDKYEKYIRNSLEVDGLEQEEIDETVEIALGQKIRDVVGESGQPTWAQMQKWILESQSSGTSAFAPEFYSKLQRSLEDKMQNRATPEQVMSILRSQQVREDEIKWSGIMTYLEGKQKVDKAELLDFLRENEIQIEEIEETERTTRYYDYKLPGDSFTNYRELIFTLPGVPARYKSPHWGEDNIFLHVRLQDAVDDAGSKVLFIEEVQSDWHEAGREQGYDSEEVKAQIAELEEQRLANRKKYWESDEKYYANIEEQGEFSRALQEGNIPLDSPAEFKKLTDEGNAILEYRRILNNEFNEIMRQIEQLVESGRIPEAPFSKTWHEFALKKTLRIAAENGYDRIAWTTGTQQSDRYKLGASISIIGWRKLGEDHYNLNMQDPTGNLVYNETGLSLKQIQGVIGKDMAKQIQESTENWGSISPENFTVGAEGMKAFYDIGGVSSQNIPSFLNKYGKQWGAKVDTTQINGVEQPSMAITEAMKQSVLHEGQPRFSLQKDSAGAQLTEAQAEFFKDSKVRDKDGNLKVMYHGSDTPFFTVFDPNMSDDGISLFFSDSPKVADTYTRKQMGGSDIDVYDMYTPDMSAEDFNRKQEKGGGTLRILKSDAKTIAEIEERLQDSTKRLAEELKVLTPYIKEGDSKDFIDMLNATINPKEVDDRFVANIERLRDYSSSFSSIASITGQDINTDLKRAARKIDWYHYRWDVSNMLKWLKWARRSPNKYLPINYIKRDNSLEEFTIGGTMDGLLDERAAVKQAVDWSGNLSEGGRGNRYAVYVNLTNPLIVGSKGQHWSNIQRNTTRVKDLKKEIAKARREYDEQRDILQELYDQEKPDMEQIQKQRDEVYKADVRWSMLAEELERTDSGNTRYWAEYAKENGYDGVIFRDISDTGGWAADKTPRSTVAVAFSPEQVKAVKNLNPTTDPDIRYSLQTDSQGNQLKPGQSQFFANSQALDEEGGLVKVFHGTMSDFWEFSRPNSNRESDMGAGFYFTSNEEDVWSNYATPDGGDLTNKIDRYAEELMDQNDMEQEEALEEARRKFIQREEPRVIEAYLNITNPVVLDGRNSTVFNYIEDYDPETEEYGEPSGQFVEFVESIKNVLEDYEGGEQYIDQINGMYERFSDDGAISAYDAIKDAKDILGDFMDYDTGALGGNEIVRQALEDMGFDGIIDKMVAWKFGSKSGRRFPMAGVTPDTTHYIVFNSNQAKEVDNENPTDSPDIRHSINRSLNDFLQEWENAKQTYGTKPPGMEPREHSRENEVPEQIMDGIRTSDFMRTAFESPNTPEGFLDPMKLMILSGTGSYIPLSDKTALAIAHTVLTRKGLQGATDQWRGLTKSNKALTKSDLALGEQLLVNAADRGDLAEWERLVSELAAEATRAGQNLQAFSMLKKLSPQGRAYNIQNLVDKLQQDLDERTKGKGPEIIIPPELKTRLLQAKTVAEIEEIETLIAQAVAAQIPPSITDRVVAWRYLAMLGNIRTHLRNIISNIMMYGARSVKDFEAGIAEGVIGHFNKNMGRTKTLKPASPEAKAFAKQDWQVMRPALLQGGFIGFDEAFDRYKKNFGKTPMGWLLNKADQGNKNLLNNEDSIFMGKAYRHALSSYMTANRITPEFLSSGTREANKRLAEARAYASKEALKATYREANTLATWLNTLERKNALTKVIVGGLMPFKKTPLNILKRGLEYSPAGLIQAIGFETAKLIRTNQASKRAAKKGEFYEPEITAAHYIDRLASGLTGTMLFGFGIWLAMAGIVKASGDDDKEEYFEQMQGEQPYSVKIAGRTYTIDWLTPISMPLMAGVELVQSWGEEEEVDFNRVLEALLTTADPMTELSMLQGINQALNSFDENKLGAVAQSAAQSYAGQFVPTIAGQMARTADPVRRSTYASKDTDFLGGKGVETFYNKMVQKADLGNWTEKQPYLDLWGREERRPDNIALRALENFVTPYYAKELNSTAVDDEIARVFAVNGETRVLPGKPKPYLESNNERYDMEPADYTEYSRKIGQESYRALEKVFSSVEYRRMDQETKEKVIADVFDYARENAKADYAEKKRIDLNIDSIVGKVDQAKNAGINVGLYFVAAQKIYDTHNDIDPKTGVAITKEVGNLKTRKTKVVEYVDSLGLSLEQKDALMKLNSYKNGYPRD